MTPTHHLIVAAFGFAVGSAVGSFLNVCAWRLPRGESLVRPGSRCPRCKAAVAARDNVPVLGWLLLRGRCRQCRGPISPRYPIVEAAVGALFALAFTFDPALDPTDRTPAAAIARLGCHLGLTSVVVTCVLMATGERRTRRAGDDPAA